MNVPKMPNEFKGKERITHHKDYDRFSRDWTKEEEKWIWNLYKSGYKIKEMAESVDRDITSVSIKIKRLKKRYNEYNERHLEDKYNGNFEFLKLFDKNVTILDVFCGVNSFYEREGYNVLTNDKNKNINAIYHMDADKFLSLMLDEGNKFDIVDLDPFGASIIYLEKALKIAEKGLVMTLGELGHKRFKRLDFISRYYPNITKIEDITIDNMIKYILEYSKKQGYNLSVVIKKDWNQTGRVWFKIN